MSVRAARGLIRREGHRPRAGTTWKRFVWVLMFRQLKGALPLRLNGPSTPIPAPLPAPTPPSILRVWLTLGKRLSREHQKLLPPAGQPSGPPRPETNTATLNFCTKPGTGGGGGGVGRLLVSKAVMVESMAGRVCELFSSLRILQGLGIWQAMVVYQRSPGMELDWESCNFMRTLGARRACGGPRVPTKGSS